MKNSPDMQSANVWLALGLILVGILFLLDNLDLFDLGDLWVFWPVIFIGVGMLRLKSSNYRDRTSASFFIGCGLLLLLLNLDILEWGTIWQFWPVILILVGLSIIYRRSRADSDNEGETSSENRIDVVAIFGGNEKKIASDNFKGGNITTICGGAKLDFEAAKLSKGKNVIDLFTVCGGVEMYVPNDWNVEIKGLPLFGGFEDSRRKVPSETTASDKTLTIKGLVIFGGLHIKNA